MLAISLRREFDLWWVSLVAGLLQIAIAFWASAYVGRSIALLIAWVGFGAAFRGITEIVSAFHLYGLREGLKA